MIAGRMTITSTAVETHKDSYLLEHLTVVSVRRPFLATGMVMALGGTAFSFRFADLLYPHELLILGTGILTLFVLGRVVAQIQLLSRDLRGSELSGMIWGTYVHLNRLRAQIIQAVREPDVLDRKQPQ